MWHTVLMVLAKVGKQEIKDSRYTDKERNKIVMIFR